MLRFILVISFVVLFLILSTPLLLIEWIMGKLGYQNAKNRSSLAIVNWAFRVCLFMSGTKITVIGEENVPKDQAVLYIANHRSYFDILLTYVRVPRPTGYVAKKEMLKYPLLRDWMKNLHCKFLDREDMKAGLKMILDAIEDVKNGVSICIFPEGTRNPNEDPLQMLPFKEGSLKIAEKSGCPIIPMALTGSADIFEKQFPKVKKAHVIIEYGKPIYPQELSKEERKHLGAYTQEVIEQMLLKHKETSAIS
ncbi:MAG: lysophospholipid acyltransferase family protein [Lachnospiraceae bacterium]|nr:lysophospholipid acyltransferase family protein [Lachnospiraceae bacterium]